MIPRSFFVGAAIACVAVVVQRSARPPRVAASRPRAPTVSRTAGCTLADAPPSGPAGPAGTVTVSADETLAVVSDSDNDQVVRVSLGPRMRVQGSLSVGRGPAQVLLGRDGRLFVAERGGHSVAVFDLARQRLLCRAAVAVDPVGLALSPDGARLYVASGLSHTLSVIDAATFALRGAVRVPREPRAVAVSPDGARVLLSHVAGSPLSVVDAARLAVLDIAPPPIGVEPGESLFRIEHIPGCDVDQVVRAGRAPSAAPQPSQAWSLALDAARGRAFVPFMVGRTGRDVPPIRRRDVYGARMLDGQDAREKVSLAVGVFDLAALRWERVSLPEGNTSRLPLRIRVPSAATLRPRDGALLVAGLGSDLVAEIAVNGAPRELRIAPTVGGPAGIYALRDGSVLAHSQMLQTLRRTRDGALEEISVADDALPSELALGRLLFHTADDARLSSGGLACAGCHPDGRDDGLTWFLRDGPRQTPTLAGRLEYPFNWNGANDTLSESVARTLRRLGGTGLPREEHNALVAWIQRGLAVPSRGERVLDARETRGRALFEGDAGCDGCHDPARNFTDGARHTLGGLRSDETVSSFDTPSLRLVGYTAPYFHDGRYATLRDLLGDRRHRMGTLDALSPEDLGALAAYLETL